MSQSTEGDPPRGTKNNTCETGTPCPPCKSKISCIILAFFAALILCLHVGEFHILGIHASLLIYILGAVIALWQIIRQVQGLWGRFICGLIGSFLTIAGFVGFFICGDLLLDFISRGGAAWFAALTMLCCGLIGLLFAGIFGYLLLHFMNRGLWLANAAFSFLLLITGLALNHDGEQNILVPLEIKSGTQLKDIQYPSEDGEQCQDLGFTLEWSKYQQDDNSALCALITPRSRQEERMQSGDSIKHKNWTITLQRLTHYPEGTAALLQFNHQPGQFLTRCGHIGFCFSLLICLFWNKLGRKKPLKPFRA